MQKCLQNSFVYVCFLSEEQPNATYEWQRDIPVPKVYVWLRVTATKLYGPFMFKEPTVTGVTYLEMLQQYS